MPSRVRGGRKLKEFLRKARAAKNRSKQVDVGFFSSARYSDGTYVASVAAWQEFGVEGRIPERPFLRTAIAGADRELVPIMKAGIDPKTMELDERTASLLGEVMKARIQRSIVALREPPNAPSTIARKGSSNPLIDIGVMRQSVDYEVGDAGSE